MLAELYADSEAVRRRLERRCEIMFGVAGTTGDAFFLSFALLFTLHDPLPGVRWFAAGVSWIAVVSLPLLYVPGLFIAQGARVTDTSIEPARRGFLDVWRRRRASIPVSAVERLQDLTSEGVHGLAIVWRERGRERADTVWAPEVEDYDRFLAALERVLPGRVPVGAGAGGTTPGTGAA